MKNKFLKLSVMFVVALCTLTTVASSASAASVVVGAKNFTESQVVSEIYALALEKEGFKVSRKQSISSSVIPTAIKKGQIDLYPEYTGTALLTILKGKMTTDPDQAYQKVKAGLAKQGLTALPYAPGNDGQGIAIRASVAKKYGIRTISDLQRHAEKIRFASQGEFDKRTDGLAGLAKKYGDFKFKSNKVYDNALKYQILSQGKADATPAYTTEGQLASKKYVVLKDDKNFWPPYNLMPIVTTKVAKQDPKLVKTINQIDRKLTTKTLIKLNKQVDLDKHSYKSVAKKWYQANFD